MFILKLIGIGALLLGIIFLLLVVVFAIVISIGIWDTNRKIPTKRYYKYGNIDEISKEMEERKHECSLHGRSQKRKIF